MYAVHFRRLYLLAVPVTVVAILAILAYKNHPSCSDVSEADRLKLTKYFQVKYGLEAASDVEVESGSTLAGTCLRRISVSTDASGRRKQFVLSENKRFVFPEALDLDKPVKAFAQLPRVQTGTVNMADLTAGDLAASGPADAPVTMVVFSDFQCPFCKRFGKTMREVESKEPQRLHVVFREYPLPIHEHAREDAELAACTAHQSVSAFWALHDYFFDVTPSGTGDSSPEGGLRFLKNRKDINIGGIEVCLKEHRESTAVDRDLELGHKYGVSGTPTIFINGTRMVGAKEASALSEIIEQKANAASPVSRPVGSKGEL